MTLSTVRREKEWVPLTREQFRERFFARFFDPVVVTSAKIDGGSTNKVIPEAVNLLGTIRSLSEASLAAACSGITRVAERITQAHECEAEVTIERGLEG